MAKMIPNHIDQEDPRRNGERLVFKLFADDKVKGTAFYSMPQINHKHKMIGEVDFLYITQKGILCLEVKGGQEIIRRDRSWYSVNHHGVKNEIKDPFKQAMDCMYALRRYLADTYGKDSPEANYLMGYGVVFPECIFTGKGNDLETSVVYDCRNNLVDFPKYLDSTLDYWARKEIEKHGRSSNGLSKAELQKLEELLRGDFSVVPSMNLEIQNAENQMLELTEEQYDILEEADENPRMIIQGGAGSGKTLLAVERARQLIAKGKKVLYVCYNRNVLKYVKKNVANQEKACFTTYHSLLLNSLDNTTWDMSTEDISDAFLNNASDIVDKYDCLIVDEGQDLMLDVVWEVLDKYIVNGLSEGNWLVFLDPNQNIFSNSEQFEYSLKYLREMYAPSYRKLNKNCRNTEQIGRRTSIVSIVPSLKYMRISGPNVVTRSYKDNFIELIKKDIASFLASGGSTKDIVILSRRRLENSEIKNVGKIAGHNIKEIHDLDEYDSKCLNYYTIQSFKGLEAKVVFLIDIDGFESLKDRQLNYTGMSRAKILLYMYYNEELKSEYTEVIMKGQDLFDN